MIERKGFEELTDILEKKDNSLFLQINGNEGTGKTLTLDVIKDYLRSEGYIVLTTTPSTEEGGTIKKAFTGSLEEIVKSDFEIMDMMFIHHNGILMAEKNLSMDVDSDIAASMLEAVQNFLRDTFGGEVESSPRESFNILSFEDNVIAVHSVSGFGTFAVMLRGKMPDNLIIYMKRVVDEIKSKYGDVVKNWSGKSEETREIPKLFMPVEALSERKRDISFVEEEYLFVNRFVKKFSELLEGDSKIAILADDIDKADKLSRNLLNLLPKMYKDKNLAVIASSQSPVDLKEYETINLGNFDYEETKELVRARFALKKPAEDLIKYLHEKTKGNPHLLVENLDKLLEEKFDFWNYDKLPEIMEDFKQLAEYKISKLSQEEKEFLSYLSLFGEFGIPTEYVNKSQKAILSSLKEKGYLFVDREISFVYSNMVGLLRAEASTSDYLVAAENLEKDKKYKQALSLRMEYLKKTGDKSQLNEVMGKLSNWVDTMQSGKLPTENPFPIIEELLEFPEMKDSSELLKIIDNSLFALPNIGNLDEQEEILKEVMEFAERLGFGDIFARAGYKYIRVKYKKRQFKESLSLIEELSKKWDEMGVSEIMYERLENTRIGVEKEIAKENKDVNALKNLTEKVKRIISEREKTYTSGEKVEVLAELFSGGMSAYSWIAKLSKKEKVEELFGSFEAYENEVNEFIGKLRKFVDDAGNDEIRASMLRLIAYYHLEVKDDTEKAYTLLKEAERYTNPNDLNAAFVTAPFISYAAWKSKRYGETIEEYDKWYPIMVAFGNKEADYLKQNAIIAKRLKLIEEIGEFVETASKGAVASLADDTEYTNEKYKSLYEKIYKISKINFEPRLERE